MVGAANGLDPMNILHVNHDQHTVTLIKIGVDTTVNAQHKDFVRINYITLQEQ